jgi:ubiquitin C-terminal hydrolase
MFAFIPKQNAQKEKRSKNQILKNMKAESMTEQQIMNEPLEKCLENKSRGGLCGLQNLGNTCFMNSVIQCLSNTEPLAKYFIYGCYMDHINDRNALGTRGRLAQAFSELLTEMYVGEMPYVAPWDVKNVIARRAIQFQGFAQHDSQEMLSFLLETLHEDLNDITSKPYVEYKDFDGRKDDEVSAEYWAGFK